MSLSLAVNSPGADAKANRLPRSVGIDLVRLLGLMAVVIGHTTDVPWIHHVMVAWDVPVFFVISGYLWNPTRTLADEFRHRSRKLLVPYLAWMLISVVICLVFLLPERPILFPLPDHPLFPAATDAGGTVLYQAVMGGEYIKEFFGPLWFVTAMWSALMITRWSVKINPYLPWLIGIVGVAWGTIDRPSLVAIPENIGMGLVAVFFLCVGMLLKKYRHIFKYPFVSGLFIAGIPLIAAGFDLVGELHPKGAYLGRPFLGVAAAALISVGLILLGEGVQSRIPPVIGSGITNIASCGYAIFIGHCVLRELYFRIFGFNQNGLWMFLACFLGSMLLGLAIKRTALKSVLL